MPPLGPCPSWLSVLEIIWVVKGQGRRLALGCALLLDDKYCCPGAMGYWPAWCGAVLSSGLVLLYGLGRIALRTTGKASAVHCGWGQEQPLDRPGQLSCYGPCAKPAARGAHLYLWLKPWLVRKDKKMEQVADSRHAGWAGCHGMCCWPGKQFEHCARLQSLILVVTATGNSCPAARGTPCKASSACGVARQCPQLRC